MDGLIAAMAGFIFVCIMFPKMVRNRSQFYAAFGVMVLVLLLLTLGSMFPPDAPARRVFIVIACLLATAVFVLLVLATGGLSIGELTGEVMKAIEVMRRGETEKTVIIPLTGQQPKPKEEETPPRVTLEQPPRPASGKGDDAGIPLV